MLASRHNLPCRARRKQNKEFKMMNPEASYAHLLEGLAVDISGHWTEWDWKQIAPMTSYDHARLEEYRDSVIVAYRLYNRIGLEHLKRLLAEAPRDAKILDAGGGTGRKAIPLAGEGFKHITILDHAPGWLRLAEEKAKAAGLLENLKFVVGDVRDMPQIEDESFDYVFAMGGVVSYCGDPAAAIKEMSRVLKKGGKLVADGIHNRLGSLHLLSNMGSLENLEEMAYNPEGKSRIATLMPEGLEEMAVAAGLKKAKVWSEFMFLPDEGIRIGKEYLLNKLGETPGKPSASHFWHKRVN
jgi:ubiquinone/menaquinone biosynthesis C-methylase UbiE